MPNNNSFISSDSPGEGWRGGSGSIGWRLIAVVSLAARALGGAHCGISACAAGRMPETIAATDVTPVQLDRLQAQLGQGPSLLPCDSVIASGDVAYDPRWPQFAPLCAERTGVRSILCAPILLTGTTHSTLTCASPAAGAFRSVHALLAQRIARLAAPLIESYVADERTRSWLESLDGPGQTARALGIVMARYRVTSSAAFVMLMEAGQDVELGLLEVAAKVLLTGRLPDRAPGKAGLLPVDESQQRERDHHHPDAS